MKTAIKIALIATATVATAGAAYYGHKFLQARKAAATAKADIEPFEYLVKLKNVLERPELSDEDRVTYTALRDQLSNAMANSKGVLVKELVIDLKLLMALVK